MNILNFKKIIGSIGLVTIISSPTTVVVTSLLAPEKTERQLTNIEMVVKAMNDVKYSMVVDIYSNINNLKNQINPNFIKEKLPHWVRKIFDDKLFSLNKVTKEDGNEITDSDLGIPKVYNTKINYNYGHKKNQVTNLEVEVVTPERPKLIDAFSNFQFVDNKGIRGFLDANDLTIITEQVLARVSRFPDNDLDKIGLFFVNRTSNSITLKAKSNSKVYSGEVKLTWNLKLFEVYGYQHSNEESYWVVRGLKGFFYLDKNDNNIKFFDFLTYAHAQDQIVHSNYDAYHKFTFSNKKMKKFTFIGKETAAKAAQRFGNFAFNSGVRVSLDTPEYDRIKTFKRIEKDSKGNWYGFTKQADFDINNLGELKQIS